MAGNTVETMSLMSLFDSWGDGCCEIDAGGKITVANGSAGKISGYETTDLAGKQWHELFEQEKPKEWADLKALIGKSGGAFHSDGFLVRKDGKKIPVRGSVVQVTGTDPGSAGFLASFRDLSEKTEMEDELARTRKLEAVGIMAGGFAHDYNNALTAIMGNLSLAKMDAESNVELMEVLNDAEQGALKVLELTKRLAVFAKAGSPVKKPESANNILNKAIEISLKSHSGTLVSDIAPDLWSVEVDESQIRKVIQHVLANAFEAMPKGGKVTVTAKNVMVEEPKFHHEISLQPEKYVMVSIRDEGSGINPDDKNKIYDPYFTTKDSKNGMGLAIGYAILKRHHGYIDVESAPGKGSEFLIYIPVNG